ncbi:hypothetical protein [Thioclava atlantica]|uniref:hypothetical protein n=1 Tax=Thioclava atlantica TaxID=1317124 RepID=UPI0012E07791|nr:hypothetical protein [Thioclava atlantica]
MKLVRGSVLIAAVALSACGGGGSVVAPPVYDPLVAPDGSDISSVIAFAKKGGTIDLGNGVTRYTNTQVINSKKYAAWVDVLPGYGDALVSFQTDDQGVTYTMTGDTPTVVSAPTGVYTGQIELSYKQTSADTWRVATGNVSVNLDLANGTAAIDSIASNADNNIEVFGNATVSGAQLASNTMTMRMRDGAGTLLYDKTGSLDGKIITGTDTSAIVGTVNATDSADGYELNGGLTTGYNAACTANPSC